MTQPYLSIQDSLPTSGIEYSICTIVNDIDEYHLMKTSFEDCGFTQNCEYLIADNTSKNEFDAYKAIALFLKQASGKYLIIVHQDVRCIDSRNVLAACLDELNEHHSAWAICGNAGAIDYHEFIIHINYPSSELSTYPNLPKEVNSLDENLLIIKRSSNITISSDLTGFHLYGTDLCIIAKFLGYKCYVIRFTVQHLSKGNLSDLKRYKKDFIDRYGKKLDVGYVQTTCTGFYLSNSVKKNRLFNSKLFFFIIKQFKRYPYLLSKLIRGR